MYPGMALPPDQVAVPLEDDVIGRGHSVPRTLRSVADVSETDSRLTRRRKRSAATRIPTKPRRKRG